MALESGLGKAGPEDISGQSLEGWLVLNTDGPTAVDVKSAVLPGFVSH